MAIKGPSIRIPASNGKHLVITGIISVKAAQALDAYLLEYDGVKFYLSQNDIMTISTLIASSRGGDVELEKAKANVSIVEGANVILSDDSKSMVVKIGKDATRNIQRLVDALVTATLTKCAMVNKI